MIRLLQRTDSQESNLMSIAQASRTECKECQISGSQRTIGKHSSLFMLTSNLETSLSFDQVNIWFFKLDNMSMRWSSIKIFEQFLNFSFITLGFPFYLVRQISNVHKRSALRQKSHFAVRRIPNPSCESVCWSLFLCEVSEEVRCLI